MKITRVFLGGFLFVFLLCLVVLFTSCKEDDYGMPIPKVNKNLFKIGGEVKKDTLFLTNSDNPDYFLLAIDLYSKSNKKLLATANFLSHNAELKGDDGVLGKVEYRNEDVYKIEVSAWCTITKILTADNKKAYVIETKSDKISDMTMTLGLNLKKGSGASVVIE